MITRLAVALGLVLAGACGSADSRTSALFDVGEGAGFYDAPFPVAHRLRDDGTLVVADFPNTRHAPLLAQAIDAMEQDPVGFGTTSAIFLPFDGPLDPDTLPTRDETEGTVQIIDVDPSSPERGRRYPVWVDFRPDAETYSPANLLAVLPRPGLGLRPATAHAVVVLDGVRAADGRSLGVPPALDALLAGRSPGGPAGERLQAAFAPLLSQLAADGIDPSRVKAATVFTTGDPIGEMVALRRHVLEGPPPVATDLVALRDHDGFCVVEGRVTVPLFQDGERPYTTEGGAIRVRDGVPEVESSESIRFALAIPKGPMPEGGFPLLFYSAGQGGKYTQVVDRSFAEGPEDGVLGRGPAYYLATVGVASLGIEAPMVGPRHPTGDFSGLEFFSTTNVLAFRDNTRQAAIDFTTLVRMADTLGVPESLCPGVDAGGEVRFDPDRYLYYGHSTGATIGTIVLGIEDRIRAGLLSGIGGSYLYQLTIKTTPFVFADVVALLLRYDPDDEVSLFDPELSLAQTLWEPMEPINWAPRWALDPVEGAAPKHVMLIEGVVDGYQPPPAVAALALAMEATPVRPTVEPLLEEAVAIAGISAQDGPVSGNLSTPAGPVTSAVVQHVPPEGINGHYVPFEDTAPKYQYRCFFRSFLDTGLPAVQPPMDDPLAPCPM